MQHRPKLDCQNNKIFEELSGNNTKDFVVNCSRFFYLEYNTFTEFMLECNQYYDSVKTGVIAIIFSTELSCFPSKALL